MKKTVISVLLVSAGCLFANDVSERIIPLRYECETAHIPPDAKQLRLWLPVPQDNPQQTVAALKFYGDFLPELQTEPVYGNQMAYYEISNPPAAIRVGFTCEVTRKENRGGSVSPGLIPRFLQANRLIPLNRELSEMAETIAPAPLPPEQRARAFYDHVLHEMTYDKSGAGWGRGDFQFACDARKG
ncbi:MAG: transglutaminase-like domain-containing protein [Pontiellaceae bacterium]|jgi:hypothetical protein|nr:transglutaminase-like domain-containing protein [Pontiellaceae bacterium]